MEPPTYSFAVPFIGLFLLKLRSLFGREARPEHDRERAQPAIEIDACQQILPQVSTTPREESVEHKSRPCSDEDACIRREIANLLDPDAPIVDRIHVAACAVALTCGNLTTEELHSCAGRLFDVTPDCGLADAFVFAHQTERDALASRLDIETPLTNAQ